MCNISEGIYEEGIEKGIEKGIIKGITKGAAQGKRELIECLMKTNRCTIEDALKIIGMTPDDYAMYKSML